jgi:hypothetical protein
MRLAVRHLFLITLFIGLFIMTLRPVTDPDFWWHLRTGQLIVQTHAIPMTDVFSYTNFGKPWVAHEWLSELLIFGLFRMGGYGLLILSFSLIITGAFFLSFLRCPKDARPYIAGFSLLLGALATAPTWGVRPQMLSLLFTSLVLYLLTCYWQDGNIKYILSLPLITLLWVNLHAGYFLGLVIIAIFIFGGLIEHLLVVVFNKKNTAELKTRLLLYLSCIFVLSIFTTLINPNGVHIIIYPFQTLTSQAMQQFIQEWFSPDFHQLMWQPLAWFILLLIGFGMVGNKSISAINIILTIVFGYAALLSARHTPLFAIVAIPVLSEEVGSIIKIPKSLQASGKLLTIATPLLVLSMIMVSVIRLHQVVQDQSVSEQRSFPKAAVDWININQPSGRIFNSYGWGGYLIWRLYPAYPVYIDGRADVYGDKFIYHFMDIYHAEPGWENYLLSDNVDHVLIEPNSNLSNTLRLSSLWKIDFEDEGSILFSRK